MKPHPRPPVIRKTIKWGGAAVTVLLVVVWIGSGWWQVWLSHARSSAGIAAGRLILVRRWPSTVAVWPASFNFRGCSDGFNWRYLQFSTMTDERMYLPLWPLPLAALLATVTAWGPDVLAHRRARLNLCRNCNYDRTGIAADAKCPECGH